MQVRPFQKSICHEQAEGNLRLSHSPFVF
jgi:hypothetical protein